ncbi:MAG: succinate--CoA ligase subunit alpha [Chloroflexi bacterium]|nr:succinate--CoA ligase subunit alpha [Chloroflexota bacterium]MCY3583811.1 succinate--CoA ligase subunit alpha [Chloroflexota bacterium]MCY3716257.1 succinate--CoA ligase subunit alpha [Chloroflexota bacterium]MDE2650414.1 succinate--CoA ligase subunit alpha [Chloroflexota bacterium]MXX49631.1 succinate--CoA ligase subunit alpha [Chloroflexota bacterium]
MSILIDRNSLVLVQGITGRQGGFHARLMMAYGTQVVGGVTPGKGGEWFESAPVFDTVRAAVQTTNADTSLVTVPARFAPDAVMEAADAGIKLIICLTEHIPVADMMKVVAFCKRRGSRLIGPNCPGVMTPGQAKVGIIPAMVAEPGNVGVVSKSGTLTYEVGFAMKNAGIGISTIVGIGGDPVIGTTFVDVLEMFENDPETEKVALLGEIGGSAEIVAADYIKNCMTKPVAAFIAGRSAPPGKRMGHAGAIVDGGEGSADEKIQALEAAGARVANNPEAIPSLLA